MKGIYCEFYLNDELHVGIRQRIPKSILHTVLGVYPHINFTNWHKSGSISCLWFFYLHTYAYIIWIRLCDFFWIMCVSDSNQADKPENNFRELNQVT